MYGDRLPWPLRRPRNDVFGGEAEGRGNPIAVYGDRLPRPLRRPRNDVFGWLLGMTFLASSGSGTHLIFSVAPGAIISRGKI